MKRKIATGLLVGSAAVMVAVAPAWAVYPPNPSLNTSLSATTVEEGGSITFTFGVVAPFSPGATVTVTSQCTGAGGVTFAGPGTTTSAGANGQAVVTLVFTRAGQCVVTATGQGPVPVETNGAALKGTADEATVVQAGFVQSKSTVVPAASTIGTVTATATVTILPKGGGGGGGGGTTGGGTTGGGGTLPKTGANDALTIAAVGGGLLLAGVGAVVVARRRERTSQ